MRKRIYFIFLTAGIYAAGVSLAFASGGGVYGTAGLGEMSAGDVDSSSSSYSESSSLRDYHVGIGFMVDTNCAKDELFNYRFTLGYQNRITKGGDFFSAYSYHRMMMTHTFGFGMLRVPNFRLWFGPQLAFSYEFYWYEKPKDPWFMGYMGLVLGFNINPGKTFTLSVEMGFRFGYGVNLVALEKRLVRIEPFANVGVLFRIQDNYSRGGDSSIVIE